MGKTQVNKSASTVCTDVIGWHLWLQNSRVIIVWSSGARRKQGETRILDFLHEDVTATYGYAIFSHAPHRQIGLTWGQKFVSHVQNGGADLV